MDQYDVQISELQNRLERVASPKTKAWWENYLRGAIPFRGLGIPEIRAQLSGWLSDTGIEGWPLEEQLDLALALIREPIAEDKLAGILFLQDYLYDRFEWRTLLDRFANLYAHGHIFDWSTCDWFCVRVLGPMIAQHGLPCAEAIAGWRHAENLWQARSSVVPFVKVAADEMYYPLIVEACDVLIRRDERFAKTAVGWILRDISKYDGGFVREFIEPRIRNFTTESLKNAIKYFPRDEQSKYLQMLKST